MNDLPRFLNALKILHSIDQNELVDAGVIGAGWSGVWDDFQSNPYVWLMKCGDDQAQRVWAIVEARQPREVGDPTQLANVRLAGILAQRNVQIADLRGLADDCIDWMKRQCTYPCGPNDACQCDALKARISLA